MAETDKMLSDQEELHRLIVNFKTNTEKSKAMAAATVQYLQTRIKLLEGYWEKFTANHLSLAPLSSQLKTHAYFAGEMMEATEEGYVDALTWLSTRVSEGSPLQHSPTPTELKVVSTSAHFEKVKLPKFNGNQRQWDSFRDTFSALIVSEPSIPSIIKFQHLLNCLEGQAADQMKGQEMVAEKFESAWQRLCAVYNNRFLRFRAHMRELMNLPVATRESATHLTQLLTTVSDCCATFRTLKLPYEHWDTVIIFLLEEKLSPYTKRDWIKLVDSDPASDAFPTLAEFIKFLERRVREAKIATEDNSKETSSTGKDDSSPKKGVPYQASIHTTLLSSCTSPSASKRRRGCRFCKQAHFIAYCPRFLKLSPKQRLMTVNDHHLCANCLSSSHLVGQCYSRRRSAACDQRHHARLHGCDQPILVPVNGGQITANRMPARPHDIVSERTLLATSLVMLENDQGVSITVRALLDPCASESIVSERIAQRLQLPRTKVNVAMTGSGGATTAISRHRVSLRLRSSKDPKFCLPVVALALKKVSNRVPASELKRQSWSHLHGLQLADPHYYLPGNIDCILNAAVFGQAILPEIRKDPRSCKTPVAFNSVFGWVLVGSIDEPSFHQVSATHLTVTCDSPPEVKHNATSWSVAKKDCLQTFKATSPPRSSLDTIETKGSFFHSVSHWWTRWKRDLRSRIVGRCEL